MSEEMKPLARFTPPGAERVELADLPAARAFVATERASWSWLEASSSPHASAIHQAIVNQFSSALTALRQNNSAPLTALFKDVGLPTSTSPLHQYIGTIRESDEPLAVHMTGLIVGAIQFDPSRLIFRRAMAALMTFYEQLSDASVSSVRLTLEEIVAKFHRQYGAARTNSNRLEATIAAREVEADRRAKVGGRYLRRKLWSYRDQDTQKLRASLDEMESTRALYMEHMALKAPVEYWKRKAASHRTREGNLKTTVLWYAALGGLAVIGTLFLLARLSVQSASTGQPTSVLLIYATVGIVVTTIGFWAGRVITRLYLSEVHLAIDADERATMVETYLALTSINQASKEDRSIVLASLFRPTADGIVKDDAAPDLSPAGILSRVVGPS